MPRKPQPDNERYRPPAKRNGSVRLTVRQIEFAQALAARRKIVYSEAVRLLIDDGIAVRERETR